MTFIERDGLVNFKLNARNFVPETGVVREYWFNVENTTAAPDDVEMPVQLINGSFPGPTIIADWGDTVVVHFTNSLQNNGTGLHFHRIRQNWTDGMDGVPSITQCPIASGDSLTYRWRAVGYGTGWYHSHLYVQAWDGVFGGILINGPATANYDQTTDQLVTQASTGGPLTAPNGLINGTNTYDTNGSRFETTFEPTVRYWLRIVNAAADNHLRFMIDSHHLEVIAADFVPIHPYNTTQLSIGMGQRYDVIVTAKNLTSGNFWLRAIPQEACSETDAVDNVKGIIRYDSNSTTDPPTFAYGYTDSCADEASSDLVPYLAINASETYTYDASKGFRSSGSTQPCFKLPRATIHGPRSSELSIFQRPINGTYMAIHSPFAQDHPMHLHGHDFWVLGSGYGEFDSSNPNSLTLVNAPRRDVAMMPASGYLVIAIKTDNPGAWLMHCHIAWHTSEGFAVQILERESEIETDYAQLNSTCANWKSYVNGDDVTQYDSGV
ncbi:hypothetical protein N7444_013633 [Penicillium canescens]|nr:hypothetical protein N7444_013633 [Penicillium canescens]